MTNPYSGLRDGALGKSAETLGLEGHAPGDVFGTLMEMGWPNGVATLACFLNGDASLYLSNGGGVIGMGAHTAVADAAKRFVAMGTEFLPQMREAREYPLPGLGQTAFYLLTGHARYTAGAAEDDLGNNRSALSPLFYAGQDVITQIRLVQPPR
jgi:hypothetical protein